MEDHELLHVRITGTDLRRRQQRQQQQQHSHFAPHATGRAQTLAGVERWTQAACDVDTWVVLLCATCGCREGVARRV